MQYVSHKIIFFASALILLTLPYQGFAQDPQISQWETMPALTNPARAGMLAPQEVRAAGLYRSQWGVLSTRFSTSLFSFEMSPKERWGISGVFLNSDAAGIMNVFMFTAGGSYEITKPNNGKYSLSTSLQLGFIFKTLQPTELVFDSQYQDGHFNTDIPSGELFERTTRFMPDVNFGIAYQNHNEKQDFNPFGYIGIFHINAPNESFLESSKSRLPQKYVAGGGTLYKPTPELTLSIEALGLYQKMAWQANLGFGINYEIPNAEVGLMGGAKWRYGDAVIPLIGVKYKTLTYRMSYDINISGLKEYTDNKGAIEFTLIYSEAPKKKRKKRSALPPKSNRGDGRLGG